MANADTSSENTQKPAVGSPATGAAATPPNASGKTKKPEAATQPQKILVSVVLWIFTIAVVFAWFWILGRIEGQLRTEHSVAWSIPANAALNPGPPAFVYDRASNMLSFKGVMDAQTKQQLIALFVPESTTNSAQFSQPYSDAISRLAYEANDGAGRTIALLLLLGGLSATLGGLFRLMLSFVNMICYRKSLDLVLWWPYYVLRPPVGFLIGFTVVLLAKAELLFKGEAVAAAGSLWWAGVAFIAGFAASEFTEWLIIISRTLFRPGDIKSTQKTDKGSEQSEQETDKSPEQKT